MKLNFISKNKNNRGRQHKWITLTAFMFAAFGLLALVCFAQITPVQRQSSVRGVTAMIGSPAIAENGFCWKDSYDRGVGEVPGRACGAGWESDAGLCYPKCKPGYHGVGPVCWRQPPPGWVQCGMGAAKDSKTCASVVFGQVASVGRMATNVASLGSSTALTAGMSASKKASRLAKLKQQYKELKEAFEALKKSNQNVQDAADAYEAAELGQKEYKAAGTIEDAVTEEDMIRAAAEIEAILDPTGIADTVASYTYPKCGKYGYSPTGPQTSSAPRASSCSISEDVPDMPQSDIDAVMKWIKVKTTGEKLPFCWRQTHPRGVGELPGRVADCPANYTNNGATCGRGPDTILAPSTLADCPAGYKNMGLTCYRGPDTYGNRCKRHYKCREGYTNNGCTCGRGASTLTASSMVCPEGYHKSDIFKRCIVNCPAGYTNTGETCFKPASTLGMDSMTCNPGEKRVGARCVPNDSACGSGRESDAGLCYPKCPSGFHGVGPVCWQNCDPGWTECAAGCAKTKSECGLVVAEQVYSPLVVAANIATLGLAAPETAIATGPLKGAGETLTIGSKTFYGGTKSGAAFIKFVKALQTVKPGGLAKDATLVQRITAVKTGVGANNIVRRSVITGVKVNMLVHSAENDFIKAYADDFAAQTSPKINSEIDKNFSPDVARYLKEYWGSIQLREMAGANDFQIAQDVLSAVSIIDITGVTGVVSAYTKPICQEITPFPNLSQTYAPPVSK